MSDSEPHLTFNCSCGRPMQAPLRLCGTDVHCPYEDCGILVKVPSPADLQAAEEAPPPEPEPASPESEGDASEEPTAPKKTVPLIGSKRKKAPRKPLGKGPVKRPAKPAVASPEAEAAPEAGEDGDAPAKPARHRFAAALPKKKSPLPKIIAIATAVGIAVLVIQLSGNGKKKKEPILIGGPGPAKPAEPVDDATPSEREAEAPPVEIPKPKPRPPRGEMSEEDRARFSDSFKNFKEEKDAREREALEALKKRVEEGSNSAMVELAEAYREGEGVSVDLEEARVLLEKACDNDYAPACLALGKLSQEELGDPSSAVNAFHRGGEILVARYLEDPEENASRVRKSMASVLFHLAVLGEDAAYFHFVSQLRGGSPVSAGGAGWVAPGGLVVTTHALVEAAGETDGEIVIQDAEGAAIPAVVAAVDPERNLALLKPETEIAGSGLFLGGEAPKEGTALGLMVDHLGVLKHEAELQTGDVQAGNGDDDEAEANSIRIWLHAGSAGSPLLNDRGAVIGVLDAGRRWSSRQNRIISLDAVRELLTEAGAAPDEEAAVPKKTNRNALLKRTAPSLVQVFVRAAE